MIKRLFLPEKLGSFYLFKKRIVGIDIGSQAVHATVIQLKGRSRTIEKLLEEPLSLEGGATHEERIIHALRALSYRLEQYDEIACTLPSSLVIFKTLVLPFIGPKKIKMVIPFEVEPLLPFTLDQTVLDSIITSEDTKGQQTHVLVCAIKKEVVDRYVSYFSSAGLPLHKLSVDIVELYGAYKFIEPPQQVNAPFGLVAMEDDATRIAIIQNNNIITIRSLPEGIIGVARALSTTTHTDMSENFQMLLRSGLGEISNTGTTTAVEHAFEHLMQELRFTYTTAVEKLEPPQELSHIILMGAAGDIPGIADFFKKELAIPVQLLEPKKLIHNTIFKSTVPSLPNRFMISISVALQPDFTDNFNMYQEEAIKKEAHMLTKQLTAGGIILLLILGSFITYSFFRVRSLNNAYTQGQMEALSSLKRSFKLKPSQTVTLAQATKAAETELKKEEEAWQRLSNENRYIFLRILSELSKCITIKDTQLDLTSIIITDTTVKLYGSVPGYPQLTKLQSQLECPFFKRLPKLQDWNFKSEPITLTINKEEL